MYQTPNIVCQDVSADLRESNFLNPQNREETARFQERMMQTTGPLA
jgi:hypothetical protein